MVDARTLTNLANDVIDIMEAIKRRGALAQQDPVGPNPQANRLGTSVSGTGSDGTSYADPTADEAGRRRESMERVQTILGSMKEDGYKAANELREWAPNRPADDGVRRCGENDCDRPHWSRGMCNTHYRRWLRARAAQRAAEEIS